MTLPVITRQPPDPAAQRRLRAWIAEWELLLATESEATSPTAPVTGGPLHLQKSDQTVPLQAGDIRLLHPALEPHALRYVAIVAPQGTTAWIVVPLGLLAEPATPGEFQTDHSAPPLRVLSVWNRLPIPADALQRCWLVDRLTSDELAWLQTAIDPEDKRATIPPLRTGPPLRHPLDPRHDYLDREAQFRQNVLTTLAPQVHYDIHSADALLKAAEDHAPYGEREADRATDSEDEPS